MTYETTGRGHNAITPDGGQINNALDNDNDNAACSRRGK